MASPGNSTKHTKKTLCWSFSNSSKRQKRTLPKSFYAVTITLIIKPKTLHKKRKLQASIFDEYRCKNPQQDISESNPTTHKKDYTPWSSWIHSRVTRMVQHMQINQRDTPHQQKTKATRSSQKMQTKHLAKFSIIHDKITLTRVGIWGTYLNKIKNIYDKPTANVILNGKAERLLAKFRNKTRMPTLTSTQHSIGSPSHSNQTRNKRYPNWSGRGKTVTICRWHDALCREA